MKKSLAFVALLMGFLIAQVVCPNPPQLKSSTEIEINGDQNDSEDSEIQSDDSEADQTDQEEEDIDDDEEDDFKTPLLTCTVFKDNTACNAMCTIIGSIYAEPIISGTCDVDRNCNCSIDPDATLDDFWKRKFNSKIILRQIHKNPDLADEIVDVLRKPYRTPEQSKQDLAELLSPEQMENLFVNDKETRKLFDESGEPNTTEVQKYVAKKLKSLKPPLEGQDYIRPLVKVLDTLEKEDKNTFDLILHLIRRSQNKRLNSLIDDYVEENKILENWLPSDDPETLVDILDTAIINETIKRPRPATKSGANNEFTVPDLTPYRVKIDVDWFDDNTNVNEDIRWTLDGIDKNQVAQLKTGNKCWEKPAFYKVCLTRTKNHESLSWYNPKGSTLIKMEKSANGDISQNWLFRNISVELDRKTNGAVKQIWAFTDSRWEYFKTAKGSSRQEWDGKEDWKAVEKYKKFIESWCAINDFYLGKENCIIY